MCCRLIIVAFIQEKKVKAFLDQQQIKSMIWPPYSPDLNIVEDIWSLISTEIYDNVQFQIYEELESQVTDTIDNINNSRCNEIAKLFSTMSERLIRTIEKACAILNAKT